MNAVRMILIAGLVLGLMACATQAEGKKGGKSLTVSGKVTAVSESSITVKPGKKDAEEVTVAINEETKIKVNGKPATAKDIQVGMKATVKHNDTAATAIVANGGDKKKDKKGKTPKE